MALHQPYQEVIGAQVVEFLVAGLRIHPQLANQRFMIG